MTKMTATITQSPRYGLYTVAYSDGTYALVNVLDKLPGVVTRKHEPGVSVGDRLWHYVENDAALKTVQQLSLSHAQQRALRELYTNYVNNRNFVDAERRTLTALANLGLVTDNASRRTAKLTPLGLAVAQARYGEAVAEEQAKRDASLDYENYLRAQKPPDGLPFNVRVSFFSTSATIDVYAYDASDFRTPRLTLRVRYDDWYPQSPEYDLNRSTNLKAHEITALPAMLGTANDVHRQMHRPMTFEEWHAAQREQREN